MAHLPESTLRRLYDEPPAVTERDRVHFASCADCQARFEPVAASTRESMAILAVPGVTVDAEAALARIRPRLGAPVTRTPWRPRLLGTPPRRAWIPRLAAVGVAAALSVLLVGTGVAENVIQIFEPQTVQVVPIQTGDLAGLPDLSKFGDMKVLKNPQLTEATSAADAAAQSGLPVLKATGLPSGVDTTHVSYGTIPLSSGSFTFSAARAQAYAASSGRKIPAMPDGMDGTTLTVTGGPAEFELFGEIGRGIDQASPGAGRPSLPTLAIGVMKSPVVSSSSSKIGVNQLKSYLKQLDPKLGPAIDSIGGSGNVLPIPVPVDRAQQTKVDINGVPGVALGDNTGLGSGVIWVVGGRIWAVAGTVTQEQAIAIARSLQTG